MPYREMYGEGGWALLSAEAGVLSVSVVHSHKRKYAGLVGMLEATAADVDGSVNSHGRDGCRRATAPFIRGNIPER